MEDVDKAGQEQSESESIKPVNLNEEINQYDDEGLLILIKDDAVLFG